MPRVRREWEGEIGDKVRAVWAVSGDGVGVHEGQRPSTVSCAPLPVPSSSPRTRGSLVHDDRLDSLAMAVAYWVEVMGKDNRRDLSMTTVEFVKECLMRASAVAAIFSAICWFRAATVTVRADDPAALHAGGLGQEGINVWYSVKRQGRWNGVAAAFTGLAAVLQAVQSLL